MSVSTQPKSSTILVDITPSAAKNVPTSSEALVSVGFLALVLGRRAVTFEPALEAGNALAQAADITPEGKNERGQDAPDNHVANDAGVHGRRLGDGECRPPPVR